MKKGISCHFQIFTILKTYSGDTPEKNKHD